MGPSPERAGRAPTPEEIARVEKELPGTRVRVAVEEGRRLGELRDQDSYSYELGVIFMGARDGTEPAPSPREGERAPGARRGGEP